MSELATSEEAQEIRRAESRWLDEARSRLRRTAHQTPDDAAEEPNHG